jgi:hypothetical protein
VSFARLIDEPSDLAGWAVLADELQLAGDPRGELMALSLSGKPQKLKVRLQKYLARTLDEEARAALERHVELTLEHGLWATLTARDRFGAECCDVVAKLLAHPMAALLGALELQSSAARGPQRTLIALERGAPALRKLALSAGEPWNASGAFAAPRLQHARLWNVATLEAAEHARLEHLQLWLAPNAQVGPLRLPALRWLELTSLGDLDLSALRLDAPALRRLELAAIPGIVEQLVAQPFAPALERLGFRSFSAQFDRQVGDALLARLARFERLRRLDWPEAPERLQEALAKKAP